MRHRLLLLGAGLAWACVPSDAASPPVNCLYSVWVGSPETRVVTCPGSDPQRLAGDKDIQAVIKSFGLDGKSIQFEGCKGARFAAMSDWSSKNGPHRYVITYPVGVSDSYVAPISHELAHVLQIENAGGIETLRQRPSKQIELGADYLTGLVFAQALEHLKYKEFQQNLSLIGLYTEMDVNAHGTPAQRTAAFRRGANKDFGEVNRNMRDAIDDFFANEYASIVQF